MTGGIGTKEIRTIYPHATGITATSKTDGRVINLVGQKQSLVPRRNQVGL